MVDGRWCIGASDTLDTTGLNVVALSLWYDGHGL